MVTPPVKQTKTRTADKKKVNHFAESNRHVSTFIHPNFYLASSYYNKEREECSACDPAKNKNKSKYI